MVLVTSCPELVSVLQIYWSFGHASFGRYSLEVRFFRRDDFLEFFQHGYFVAILWLSDRFLSEVHPFLIGCILIEYALSYVIVTVVPPTGGASNGIRGTNSVNIHWLLTAKGGATDAVDSEIGHISFFRIKFYIVF